MERADQEALGLCFLGEIFIVSIFLLRVLRLMPSALAVATCLPEYLLKRISKRCFSTFISPSD